MQQRVQSLDDRDDGQDEALAQTLPVLVASGCNLPGGPDSLWMLLLTEEAAMSSERFLGNVERAYLCSALVARMSGRIL